MGTVNQEEQLSRIADALECIAANTDSMEKSLELVSDILSDCQVKNQYNSAIAITGSIDTL